MSNFKQWFETKLEVGSFPFINNDRFNPNEYDYVINVSDEFYPEHYMPIISVGVNYHWFPMNEVKRDVGLNSIYGAMVILYLAESKNKRVYLHCHAGVNRSPTVAAAYYYMRNGEQQQKDTNTYANRLLAMCARCYLPPKIEMEIFLFLLGEKLNKNGMNGGMLDGIKLKSINNF